MRLNLTGILFALALLPSILSAKVNYSLSDLEVLEADKNYEEFLAHAHDIRPSKRSKHWASMVHHMAVGLLDFKIKRRQFDLATFKMVEKMALWPSLREDDFFLVKRETFALFHFDHCLRNTLSKQSCLKSIKKFWFNSPKNPEAGFKLTELVHQQFANEELWPFVGPILSSKFSEFYCQKPLIEKTLTNQLLRSFALNTPEREIKNKFDRIVHQDCRQKVLDHLKEVLLESQNQVIQVSLYNILKAKKALTLEEEDLILTLYLLKGPMVGEAFNSAWNRVQIISQDHKRREALIQQLKQRDPLPGQVFALPNLKKRKTLTRFVSNNIPEYVDYYAQTCLDYLEGKKIFPYGNPTIECRELFKTTAKGKEVRQELKVRFSAIKHP